MIGENNKMKVKEKNENRDGENSIYNRLKCLKIATF